MNINLLPINRFLHLLRWNHVKLKNITENITTLDKHFPVKETSYYNELRKIQGSFYVYDFDIR